MLLKCLKANVPVPAIWWVDTDDLTLYMERIDGPSLRDRLLLGPEISCRLSSYMNLHALFPSMIFQFIPPPTLYLSLHLSLDHDLAQKLGEALSRMHDANVIHGDLTTSNILCQKSASVSPVSLSLSLFSHLR